jgi:hypothetical protein
MSGAICYSLVAMSQSNEPDDLTAAFFGVLAPLVLWIESASIRLTAQETIIRERLNLTESEWKHALAKAAESFPSRPEASDGAPLLEGIPAVIDFLKRATTP